LAAHSAPIFIDLDAPPMLENDRTAETAAMTFSSKKNPPMPIGTCGIAADLHENGGPNEPSSTGGMRLTVVLYEIADISEHLERRIRSEVLDVSSVHNCVVEAASPVIH